MCAMVGGALSETVAAVSLRTKRMFSVFRLRTKNVSRDRDRTEPTLFWAGTVPETVPVWSLAGLPDPRSRSGSRAVQSCIPEYSLPPSERLHLRFEPVLDCCARFKCFYWYRYVGVTVDRWYRAQLPLLVWWNSWMWAEDVACWVCCISLWIR